MTALKSRAICIVLFLLLGVPAIDASRTRSLHTQIAFLSPSSVAVRTKSNTNPLSAAPGMSDERRKQERESEIRSTIAKLKREGKMKNKDGTGALSAEDSAMLEAEAFFSRASPVRKFEEKVAERLRIASLLEHEANEQKTGNDDCNE
ncbi:hypothetical protein MHU86_5076 [Fragilaria crotonensis]|nr:hypothetical protein MHU86_5076 [Fragilaria crotonensis]